MANAISHGLCDTPNQLKIAFKMPPKPPSPILAQVKVLVDSIAQMKEAMKRIRMTSPIAVEHTVERAKLYTDEVEVNM